MMNEIIFTSEKIPVDTKRDRNLKMQHMPAFGLWYGGDAVECFTNNKVLN